MGKGGGAKSAPIQMVVYCLFLQKSGLNTYPHTASDALAQEYRVQSTGTLHGTIRDTCNTNKFRCYRTFRNMSMYFACLYTQEFFTQMERSQTSGVYLILRTVLQLRNEFLVARGITMKDTNTRYTNTHIFVISKHE